MNALSEFMEIASDPYGYVRKYKNDTGRKAVGYFCSYAPEELIHAAGALPFRLFGANAGIHLADAHLQSYCCSLVRGMLEEALSGKLDFLDGVVFPHTCDSIQRLSDIWRMNLERFFHLDVVLPVKLDTESARVYLRDVLVRFQHDLERVLGIPMTAEALAHSVETYNRIRSAMLRLYQLRCEKPGILSGRDFHNVLRAAMVMERDRLAASLATLGDQLEQAPAKTPARGKRLLLTGSVCSHPDVYGLIEGAGGVVVWDDLCTGSRSFTGTLNKSVPPIEAIAARYAERIICPAKHSGLFQRGENLIRLVRESRAEGVIFLFLKFCDPHAFDYPYLKEMLDRERIPSMLLDMEERLPSGGQLETRFETFIQIL